MKANLEGRQAHRKEEGRVIQPLFSRRFMKWSATIIGTFFQSTRTDQNSSWEFYKISWCQIEPFGLGNWTKKVFPFFQRNIQYRARPKGPPFQFFSALCDFFPKKKFFSQRVPLQFLMFCDNGGLKIRKGHLLARHGPAQVRSVGFFESVSKLFLWVWYLEFFDTFMSFCCFWASRVDPPWIS